LADGFAYVVGRDGLAVIDIADPRQPHLISFLPSSGTLTQVNVAGRYAYYTGISDLYVVDITNPAALRVVSKSRVGPNIQNLVVVGDYAYLTSGAGFHVVNLSDPAQPAVTASLAILGVTRGLAGAGGHAHFASHEGDGQSLHIIDIGNPAQPAIAAQIALDSWVGGLHLADGYLYLTNREGGVNVWQLVEGKPAALTKVGTVGTTAQHSLTLELTVQDDYLYIVDFDEGLRIFDARDRAQLVEVGRFTPLGLTMSCTVSHDTAYVVGGWECNLHGIQMADAPQVHEIDWHLFAGTVCDFAIAGQLAYLLDCNGRLLVIDISTATQPREIGVIGVPESSRLTVAGKIVYLSDPAGAFWVVDVG
ncbi:MAG TPA: hypothetical protein PKE45_17295, partial [Caldilineaceae bacterium]|nr:hypothetical protein [Caldilineaceae bacterium]